MHKTYFKLAYRSLVKNRFFSLINIFSLAIGLACCLLISLYLYHEISYDVHQKKGDRLYQLGTLSVFEGKQERFSTTPAPMAPTMNQDFPEVESHTRLMKLFQDDKTLIQYASGQEVQSFYETSGYLADSTFFRLFTYEFKEGNPLTALNDPHSVVITEAIARKLFGDAPALGKVIQINSNTNGAADYTITGVFIPSRTPSHIDARFVLSIHSGKRGPWLRSLTDMVNNNMFYSYLLLKPGTDVRQLEAKFDAFIQKYAGADLKASGRDRKQFLTPVRDIHLRADTVSNVSPGGSLDSLYILLAIALVTLMIACVNFMNLSTARSAKRAVEIGVRKVLGAERASLIRQFLLEALLLSLVSFVCSLVLAALLLPLFEQISGQPFTFTKGQYLRLSLVFLLITLFTGLAAGLYPAFYLSAFKPLQVLKGRFTNSLSAVSLRKALVVFQFVISVALIVASIAISNQMTFLRTKDLGFQKDQQLVIPLRTSTAKRMLPALKTELRSNAAIASVGASIFYPGITNTMDWLFYKQGKPADQTKQVYMNFVDETFLPTMGIQPIAGRLFSREFPADTNCRIILNEQAIRQFDFASPADAIGRSIAANWGPQPTLFTVVGVVKDFHFKDLHATVESYGFLLNTRPTANYLIAHLKSKDVQSALADIGAAWNRLNPNEPFEYSLMDQDFAKNYQAEERLASLIRCFTVIAVFISCIGLFGLTTFSVEQRTREVGIRKVLGASTAGIVLLLSRDFLKLVVFSFLIAAPLAWYFVHQWLQGFAYRAAFSVWIILSGCTLALLIAFLTISIQSVKVALSNPVKNLRTE